MELLLCERIVVEVEWAAELCGCVASQSLGRRRRRRACLLGMGSVECGLLRQAAGHFGNLAYRDNRTCTVQENGWMMLGKGGRYGRGSWRGKSTARLGERSSSTTKVGQAVLAGGITLMTLG